MDNELAPVLSQLHEASDELNNVVEIVQLKNAAFIAYNHHALQNYTLYSQNSTHKDHVQLSIALKDWKLGCGNFTQLSLDLVNLAFESTAAALKIGATSVEIMNDVITCPSWNPYKTYKCYAKNIQSVVDLVTFTKTVALPQIRNTVAQCKKLFIDFRMCWHGV